MNLCEFMASTMFKGMEVLSTALERTCLIVGFLQLKNPSFKFNSQWCAQKGAMGHTA